MGPAFNVLWNRQMRPLGQWQPEVRPQLDHTVRLQHPEEWWGGVVTV